MDMDKLVEAIENHSGMEREDIIQAGEHGADAGFPGFTYTVDGAKFYREHSEMVDELLQNTAEDTGYDSVAELIATFQRKDMADTRDGADCLKAWFALESAGQYLESIIED